jgi:hypothetical protein
MCGTTSQTNWVGGALAGDGIPDVPIEAVKATAEAAGYVAGGPKHTAFAELVRQAVAGDMDLVVFLGSMSYSDLPGVRDAAATAFTAARKISPNAVLLVIGSPWTNGDMPPDVMANRDQVRDAAAAAGALFVDPIGKGWFAGADSRLIGSDRANPMDNGHGVWRRPSAR